MKAKIACLLILSSVISVAAQTDSPMPKPRRIAPTYDEVPSLPAPKAPLPAPPEPTATTERDGRADAELDVLKEKAAAKEKARFRKEEAKITKGKKGPDKRALKRAEESSRYVAVLEARFPELDGAHVLMITVHQMWVGMTLDMLHVSVGFPSRVNITQLPGGHLSGQLIYERFATPNFYVYVDDGKVTSIQTSYGVE
jgi:hypothetical protein